jgi:hypothetical protein
VLRRQAREILGLPGLGWVVAVTAVVPAAAIAGAAGLGGWLQIATPHRLLLGAYFLPAVTLVGVLSAVAGAMSIAGRTEAGVVDAMRRHGVSVGGLLLGKLGAAALLGLALAAVTLPGALLSFAFGPVRALELGAALLGLAGAAVVGAAVGLGVGTRFVQVRRAVPVAAGAMACLPVLLAATGVVGLP